MNVALLGLSHPHSALLLTTLELRSEVSGIYLWDEDPAVAAAFPKPGEGKRLGASTDLPRLLGRPDIKLVVVCMRHDRSAAVAAQAVAAGKHLVAEKPVGLTPAEIDAVDQAARRTGVVASVLYPRRFHPVMLAAQSLAHSGELGSLLTAEVRFLTTQVKYRDPQSWLFHRATSGGGMLLWLGCHCLDLLHFVSGDEIVEVGARLATRSGEAIDVEDVCALSLGFRSGAVGTFHAGYTLAYSGSGYANAAGYDSYLGFNHQRGRIVWPDLNPRLVVERPPAAGQSPLSEVPFAMPASAAYGGVAGDEFFNRFFQAMRGEGAPPTTLEDARRTAEIVAAAAESSRDGKFVRVGRTA